MKNETALQSDEFLLIAHGKASDVAEAKDIIETTDPAQNTIHAVKAIAE